MLLLLSRRLSQKISIKATISSGKVTMAATAAARSGVYFGTAVPVVDVLLKPLTVQDLESMERHELQEICVKSGLYAKASKKDMIAGICRKYPYLNEPRAA